MLTAHQISKSYGIQTILQDISFSINPGERVGLIGPNGCGKTTLLRILVRDEKPDAGKVTRTPADLRIGYLSQGFEPDPQQTITDLLDLATGNISQLEDSLAQLAAQLTDDPHNQSIQAAYDHVLARLEQTANNPQNQIYSILGSLELDQLPGNQRVATLSGGQKTRLALALVLLENPQLLLLDEPTNHLDIGMLEWLESWLQSFRGAALIVSHDRAFLNQTTTRILDLNPDTHSMKSYAGNYTAYLEQYLTEVEQHWSSYKDQQAEIQRLRKDIARTKEQARWVEITTTSRQPSVRRYAKKVARKALSREKKLERFLESEERVEKPKEHWQMKLDFGQPLSASKDVLQLENLSIGYPDLPPLLTGINLTLRGSERIVLAGQNGSGKTTLIRTIVGELPPVSGRVRIGQNIRIGYMSQEQELLVPQLNALSTIQRHAAMNETEARNFLHYFLFSGDDPLRPISALSYGERARLSLASLVVQGCNLLLLDEPINHLDIPSRERFEQALTSFDGSILAVVHDRYFIDRFATQIWQVDHGTITRHVLVSDI